MYAIGGLLAVIGIVLRVQLPESPRWLITRGRIEQAHQVVRMMEAIAEAHRPLKPIQRALPISVPPAVLPYAAILRDPNYLRRTVLLTAMWFVSYVTVYAFAAGFTTLLAALKYPPPEALIAPLIPQLGVLTSMLLIRGFLVLGALIAQFGISTRSRPLEEVSP